MLRGEWRERHNRIVSTEPLRPGVEAFLDEAAAAGAQMAVASSATRDWLDQQLGRLGIRDRFEVVCARDNGRVKPAPDIYLAALASLGVDAGNAIAFEDSPNGIAAAKAAGLLLRRRAEPGDRRAAARTGRPAGRLVHRYVATRNWSGA